MIIAKIKPDAAQELVFDIKIEGTKAEPTDIRFIIEAAPGPDGESVQDLFSIICRAVRDKDAIRVYIPRLLQVFRAGTYRSRLEVVLEDRLFTPLNEEIYIEESTQVHVKKPELVQTVEHRGPEITVNLSKIIETMLDKEETLSEPVLAEDQEPKKPRTKIDKSWKTTGFTGIRNPFKGD